MHCLQRKKMCVSATPPHPCAAWFGRYLQFLRVGVAVNNYLDIQ